MQEFQFFPPRNPGLQKREYDAYRKLNEIRVFVRPRDDPNATHEQLEPERKAEQKKIEEAEPLDDEEQLEKEILVAEGFESWSRRDFQQFVRALETYKWTDDCDLIASKIAHKTPEHAAEYYPVSCEKWKTLSEYGRIAEGEAKRSEQNALEEMLRQKIQSVRYTMQELKLNYPTTKGKLGPLPTLPVEPPWADFGGRV